MIKTVQVPTGVRIITQDEGATSSAPARVIVALVGPNGTVLEVLAIIEAHQTHKQGADGGYYPAIILEEAEEDTDITPLLGVKRGGR